MLTPALLDALEQCWRTQQAPLVSRLRPGLTDSQIDELTAEIGLRLPEEARTWYRWHDGTDPVEYTHQRWIGPGHSLISLADSVEQTRKQRDTLAHDGFLPPEEWWAPSWFALTPSNGSLVCDCSVAPGEVTPIRIVRWDDQPDGHAKIRTRSLGELVSWFIEAFDCGAWCYRAGTVGWDPNPDVLRWELRTSGVL